MKGNYDIKSIVLLVPNFLKLFYRLMRDSRVPYTTKLYLPAVIAYLLTPFDLIPDVIPVIGKLDDALLSFITVIRLQATVDKEIILEHWDGDPGVLDDMENLVVAAKNFIPSRFKQVIKKLEELFGK